MSRINPGSQILGSAERVRDINTDAAKSRGSSREQKPVLRHVESVRRDEEPNILKELRPSDSPRLSTLCANIFCRIALI